MQFRGLMAVLLFLGLVASGCGWSPPSAPPPQPDKCTPTDGPTPDTVSSAIAALPPPAPGVTWTEIARGHTKNCRLYWVQVSTDTDSASPSHLLFFDRNTPLGPATPTPRPYTTVINSGQDTVTVQYQWQQPSDAPGRPTGIAQVRYQLGADGKLKALDPIPNQ
jgi:hypothetical protein